ncbi:hypothetical protein PENCOP_c006G02084 [Penicillium coprophilum]|uniref:Uncharacterized protein n=1 Tax=Penicillium coprophilum TaxID=36646 RepID=A0A1V6UNS1_9EURO|nr:hypothetical protein PENCOP_c006G02084 [Penicillium coprophilum]
MENLRLCRSDNVGSKDMVPSVMIRLKKDQECYLFLKWWATSANDPRWDWGDETLPYLDIKNTNPLEPIDAFINENPSEPCFMFLHRRPHLSHTVVLALIRVKLYFILFATHGVNGAYEKNSKFPSGLGSCH